MKKPRMIFICAGLLALISLNGCSNKEQLIQEESSISVHQELNMAVQEREEGARESSSAEVENTESTSLEEAAECADLVGAKHNIPYHMTTTTTGRQFDRELAEQFDVENRLIVEDGEEIMIE
ncbi:MAG: hypothetical protein K2O06_11330 [Acetatifactor sp.]|nr:hypothetical protein [Acetatifactor sp.]